METSEQHKELVWKRYNNIAQRNKESRRDDLSLWGSAMDYTILTDSYRHLEGYFPSADLALGCGTPTEFVPIKEGDTVIDLGAGAGIDCFIARKKVGEKGHIIGVDFAEKMIDKARQNLKKLNYDNVKFICQDIENLSIKPNTADVVISNCTINLISNNAKTFKEVFRLLKKGGHFCISEIVLIGIIPEELQSNEMFIDCTARAIQLDDYLDIIKAAGFKDLKINKSKRIRIPEEILSLYLSDGKITEFITGPSGIFSTTLLACKP